MYSFTQETSFYGREREEGDPDDIDLHMSIEDFKSIGRDILRTLSYFDNPEFISNLESEFLNIKYFSISHFIDQIKLIQLTMNMNQQMMLQIKMLTS